MDFRLHFVGDEEQDDVRPLDCLHDGHDLEPVTSGPLGVVVLDVAYDDLDTGVPQVLGLGVTLAAVAQAGHKPAFDDAQVGVLLEIQPVPLRPPLILCHYPSPSSNRAC